MQAAGRVDSIGLGDAVPLGHHYKLKFFTNYGQF